jgi:hypothetical protein
MLTLSTTGVRAQETLKTGLRLERSASKARDGSRTAGSASMEKFMSQGLWHNWMILLAVMCSGTGSSSWHKGLATGHVHLCEHSGNSMMPQLRTVEMISTMRSMSPILLLIWLRDYSWTCACISYML